MKRLWIPVLFSLILMGCVKSLADEPVFDPTNFHTRPLGSSAKELLSEETFQSMVVEVQYMKGARPHPETLENLEDFLNRHLHKPGGIRVVTKEIPASADSVFSVSSVIDIEQAYRTQFTTNSEIAVYILFASGHYTDPKILGYAYRNTSAVLFSAHIHKRSNKFKKAPRAYLESRILLHEFAHLLGLVNVGSPLVDNHQDEDHGKHCTNKQCLMYYLTDTEDYPSFLIRKAPPRLDEDCLKDLKANGGK